MTNYTDKEYSPTSGLPIEGFEFAAPNNVFYRYTSSEVERVINGQSFIPISIERGAVKSGTHEDDNLDLQISMPVSTPLIQLYAFDISPPSLIMTLYRYHIGTAAATDWIVLWKGKVTSFTISGQLALLRVPSVFTSFLGGAIPNRYYQAQCNHILYDSRCKVVRASFKTTTTVASIVDRNTIVVVNDGFADGFLSAGDFINNRTGERRTIVNNIFNTVSIVFPFHDVLVGDSVELSAGCPHSALACKNKFNNILNYGGFPYIPTDNPFKGIV